MEKIQAEVRLYYQGRLDWDIEFFQAFGPTDIMIQASEIARTRRANHFNFGLATPEEEYQHRGAPRKVKGLGSSARDQVDAIKGFLGVEEKEKA